MIKLKVAASSSSDHYELRAYRAGDRLVFECTCPDAAAGRACTHRIDILISDPHELPRPSRKAAEQIQDLFRGSKAEKTIFQLVDWEARHDDAKQRIKFLLVELGRDFAGG
jgi:hypothetical protein